MGQDKPRTQHQKGVKIVVPTEEQHKDCPNCECHKRGGIRDPKQMPTLRPELNAVHPDGRKKAHPECRYCECETPPANPNRVLEKDNKEKNRDQRKVCRPSEEPSLLRI
jgi:hypothetical protein